MGMAIYRIMAVLGQLERDQTAERTRMGLAGVRNDGRWLGQPPYGYAIDEEHEQNGILIINEEEAWIVRDIFSMYDVGNKIGSICENLIVGGRLTRNGKRMWQYATIKRIIERRELYEGKLYKGLHATPILDQTEEE
jgi:DNA invertase Pin-like site-specific DNA recombinase